MQRAAFAYIHKSYRCQNLINNMLLNLIFILFYFTQLK